MPLVACQSCEGQGKYPALCYPCHGIGKLYIPSGFPHGDFDSTIIDEERLLMTDILANESLMLDVWAWLFITYADKTNWHKVHHMYPCLYELEFEMLARNLLSKNDLPGGPHRPKVKNPMDYRPYNKLREDVGTTPKVDVTEKARLEARNKELKAEAEELRAKLEEQNKRNRNQRTTIVEETVMPDHVSYKDKAKNVGQRALGAMQKGAVQGVVGTANDSLVTTLETQIGDSYPDILKTPAGRATVKAIIPLVILSLAEMDTQNRIPGKEHVILAADIALQDVSREAVGEITSAIMQHLGPALYQYQMAGRQAAAELEKQTDLSDLIATRVPENAVVEEAEELL